MPKRKPDELTGGSRDVNPQWMNLPVVQTSADQNQSTEFPLPVQRLAQRSGKSLVMEILKIVWDLPIFLPGANILCSFLAFLSTKNPGLTPGVGIPVVTFNQLRAQGTTVDYINRQIITGLANDGNINIDEPVYHDLTDGAGHGILVATDNVYVNLVTVIAGSTGTGVASSCLCKILYRWKEVSLEEYIGIVQSQQ